MAYCERLILCYNQEVSKLDLLTRRVLVDILNLRSLHWMAQLH